MRSEPSGQGGSTSFDVLVPLSPRLGSTKPPKLFRLIVDSFRHVCGPGDPAEDVLIDDLTEDEDRLFIAAVLDA